MSMMGVLKFFLGLQIKQTNKGINIHQTKYVKKFKMDDVRPMKTSMHQTTVPGLDEDSKQVDDKCQIYSIFICK